jgi:spermidine synthase
VSGVARGAGAAAPTAALAAAFGAGFGCMTAELTAVRLLAPSFGDSAYVWTNVIGVILAALAIGAFGGGRFAARGAGHGLAALGLGAAALLLVVASFLAVPLGSVLLPRELPLDAAMPAMVRGSFVAAAVLFGLPMLILGAVSPLLLTGVVRAGAAIGPAAGGLSAAGTIGSLVGTFAATHWLVPGCGCRTTLLIAAAALVVAALALVTGRRRAGAGAALLALVGLTLLPRGPLQPARAGEQLLAERESPLQLLQVVRTPDPVGDRIALRINEGLDSFHSLAIAGSRLTGGSYYDWHAVAPLLAGDGALPAGSRALSIGDAAGSLRTVYAAVHPEAIVDAVDIDAVTLALGEQHFPGPKANGGRYVLDGRVFLQHAATQWHVIHVDAYAHQVYVPAHLASAEFFRAAKARLAPEGVIACNVGALRSDDPVLVAIGGTLASVFGEAFALAVPNSRNMLLVARNGAPLRPETLAGSALAVASDLGAADRAAWQRIVATAAVAERWRRLAAGPPLVDDRPELDRLLGRSYIERDDDGGLVECRGDADPAGVEAAVYAAARLQAWDRVLALVAGSRQPTPYLRASAGDARWGQRQLRTAAAEYAAALAALPPIEADLRARVAQKLAAVEAQQQPIAVAEAVARRNGWWQAAVFGGAAVLLGLLWRWR